MTLLPLSHLLHISSFEPLTACEPSRLLARCSYSSIVLKHEKNDSCIETTAGFWQTWHSTQCWHEKDCGRHKVEVQNISAMKAICCSSHCVMPGWLPRNQKGVVLPSVTNYNEVRGHVFVGSIAASPISCLGHSITRFGINTCGNAYIPTPTLSISTCTFTFFFI